MAHYTGKGWHFQHTRHSNARKYGKAGGNYKGEVWLKAREKFGGKDMGEYWKKYKSLIEARKEILLWNSLTPNDQLKVKKVVFEKPKGLIKTPYEGIYKERKK